MIRCPSDGTLLYRRVVGGVTLDGCPCCGGAWFDKNELQVLSKDPVGLKMVDDAFPPGVSAAAGGRNGECPKCGQPLGEFEFSSYRGIRLERCKACGGIWMPHGKPSEFAAQLATGAGPELVPPSEAPSAAVAARFGPVSASGRVFSAAPAAPSGASRAAPSGDPTSTARLPLVKGVVVGNFDRSPGFFGSLSRGMRFIQGAYQLALEKPRLLLPMALGAGVQLLLAGAVIAGVFVASRHGLPVEGRPGHVELGGVAFALIGGAIGLVAALGNMVVLGMTVSMVDAYLKGLEPSLGTAWRDVLKNLWALVAMAAVTTVVNSLTRDRNGRRGILGSLVDSAWKVLACLLMPIIMVEDVGFTAAFKRAKEIHSRGLLQIAVGEVGLRAIAGLSAMVIVTALGLLAVVLVPLGVGGVVAVVCLAALLLLSLGILNAFARGAYYTCLYLWAVEVERAGDPSRALVPAPLAAALVGG